MFKNKEILVLGDSHAQVFNSFALGIFFFWKKFNVISVKGATISGIENPNSKTNAYNIFSKSIKNSNRSECIVLLGEVDTGFVLWFKHEKSNIPIQSLLEITCNKYFRFLDEVSNKFEKVTVFSTPLPTILDGSLNGEVANKRKSIQAGIKQRTSLTLKFNFLIKDYCQKNNINFIDLDGLSLSKSSGIVRNYLRHPNKSNHHYNNLFYSLIIFFKSWNKI